ncbi:hypothetical protein [Streptomyces sp. NPDC086023]|uniref:hypothetical protein n=1 Tax=Streptomyces sp. NPDC086023 TaxID=3365746 RepID=UPI0037D466F5
MSVSEEIGRTVRMAIAKQRRTARLICILLAVGAIAGAVLLIINGGEFSVTVG